MKALLLAAALCAPIPCSGQSASAEDISYWYYDIYDPFFRTGKSSSTGEALWVSRRPRSRPQSFPKRKPAGTRRVFVIGGSVAQQYDSSPVWAMGDPVLADFLGRGSEVVYCGMGGYDVYRDSLVFDEALGYSPDLIVLMTGNNECGYASGRPDRLTESSRRLRRFLGLWAPAAVLKPDARKGRPDYAVMVQSFEDALRSMVRKAKARGVLTVLCTMPRPLGLPPMPPLIHPMTKKTFFGAWAAWEKGDLRAAAAGFKRYSGEALEDASGPLWLGRCLERQGRDAEARQAYRQAQQRDLSRIAEINQAISSVAKEEGAALADLDLAFEGRCRGARTLCLFSDAVHWFRSADPFVSSVISGSPSYEVRISTLELRETFPQRLLSAIWFSHQDPDRLNEQAVTLLERLHEEDAARLERLVTTEAGLRETVAENAWSKSQAGEFDARWAAGLAHLAEMLRRRGCREKAVRWFIKALELRPGLSAARVQLALLQGGRPAQLLLAGYPELPREFPELCFWAERSADIRKALAKGSCG